VHGNLLARLDEAAAEPASGDDDEEAAAAAPLTLAIDVDEGEPATPAAAGSEVP
jgi:exoribonuclease-2